MPSLPWILLLALAVLHTVMAAPITESSDRLKRYSERIINEIKTMKNYTCPDSTAVFYSPPGDSNDCVKADLRCFRNELETVGIECLEEQQNTSLLNAYDIMKESLDRLNKLFEENSQFQNCPCEIHPKKNYKEFLRSLEQRIQKMNSQL